MKSARFVLSVIMALAVAVMIPCPGLAYAESDAGSDADHVETQVASDIEEYIDATEPAEDSDPIFGTGRIKVKMELDSLEGAKEGVTYDGSTLLSYESAAEARSAYERLCEEYGSENVVVDMPIMTAESSAKPVGWGVNYMNIDDEKALVTETSGLRSKKVTVAVIDSGILPSHEIFCGTAISPYSRSLLSEDDTIIDENGHGTAVAGILAEATTDNVDLMILKTYVDGKAISSETMLQAVRYAADNGADVINLSMGSNIKAYWDSYPELVENLINEINEGLRYAADRGVIICAATGNDGGNMDDLWVYPARSDYTLAVGALDNSGKRASFSNYGSYIDFCAPGQDLIVASKDSAIGYQFPLGSGTSYATPYISACCAFIKMSDKSAGNDAAEEYLKSIAVDYGVKGRDQEYGWGMPRYTDFVKPAAPAPAKAKKAAVTSVSVNTSTVNAKAIKNAIKKAGGKTSTVKQIVLGSKVRKVASNAFKGTKATSVTIGKNVRTISKNAFKSSNIRTITVKSTHLTMKSVKNSLKGSKVTKVRVKVSGKKATNKKYVSKYKKIFTRKNAGKKVSVRL